MRASMRCLAVFGLVAFGCSDDPLPLTGQASWGDTCPPAVPPQCVGATHSVRGAAGSPTVDVDCSIQASAGGYRVFFRIATITEGGNFDQSSEGLTATGYIPAVGQELRAADATFSAQVGVRGLGWKVETSSVGPTGDCHVFIDRVASGGFSGRISCPMVMDDTTPRHATRTIRGGVTATTLDFGDFVFTNCSAGS